MLSDIKGPTGWSGCASQSLWSFVGSPESRIRRIKRCHLASQCLTLGGGRLEVSFEMCWKSKPRLSREVCDGPLAMSAMGLGGGSGGTADPNRHQELRFTYLEFKFLPVHPEEFGAQKTVIKSNYKRLIGNLHLSTDVNIHFSNSRNFRRDSGAYSSQS